MKTRERENTHSGEATLSQRARQLFDQHQQRIHQQTDRMFAGLMLVQWLSGILAALYFSPKAWYGTLSQTHIHVWAAVFLGGTISLAPIFFAVTRPGATLTRHTIAVAQLLMSCLLIHLSGGRLETHFHVFGSLAFLAFYRDWRVIITGTLVTAADHYLRGQLWPRSVYGIEDVEAWRWLEHAGWVIFEDIFLLLSCISSLKEVYSICERDARLEESNAALEEKVAHRTRQIEYQAFHDALTGLSNRVLFLETLDQSLSRAQLTDKTVSVLYLDLDNFKQVNDTQGHEAGDIFLKEIAARLLQCVREGDIVARMGGDEFTLLLEGLSSPVDAEMVAERILEQLKQPIALPQSAVFASASIGIAYSDGYERSDMLIRDADTAMYHAKTTGKRGYAFFTPDMNHRALERLEIETGLRQALDNKELQVHYQPLFNLSTGKLSGMEALARWHHPDKGMISPARFIPIAEEVGLIFPIGYWVLEEACRCVKSWSETHPDLTDLTVNVNLSRRQLQQSDVLSRVSEVLQKTGLPASQLKLEITESVFLADVDEVVEKLRALKSLGVKLAIDDFGTGYSSMSTLATFPVDTVKIDRSFISRLDDEEGAAIVAAIISLSKAMNLDVTSEGVETAAQVAQLQGMGCDTGQGYFFAKPMSDVDMEKQLLSVRTDILEESDLLFGDSFEDLMDSILKWNNEQPRKIA